MALKFNIDPYYDDYNTATPDGLTPKEKYNRILFRPGKAIQARELTQLQSQLQHQISSHGDHMFKEGAVVVPGELHVHNNIDYIKVTTTVTTLTDLVGVIINDGTSYAKVIHTVKAAGADPDTLYIKYTSGIPFVEGATISNTGGTTTVQDLGDDSGVGNGCIATIDNGIYYVKKHFVIVKTSTIVLSKYTTDASIDIGLTVTESIVGPSSDTSLVDNAQGSPNESAPGAERYKLSAVLASRASTSTTGTFVLLVRLLDGIITQDNTKTDYNIIEQNMARRTFDESGNYTVRPFPVSMKAHDSDATKFVAAVEPSKAYVQGYEIELTSTRNVSIDKARTSQLVTDRVVQMESNNYIDVSAMAFHPDITTMGPLNIKASGGAVLATVRARTIVGLTASTYRIHVFDYAVVTAGTMATLDSSSTNFTATIDDANLGDDTAIFSLPATRVKTCNALLVGTDFNYQFSAQRNLGTAAGNGTQVVFNSTTGIVDGETIPSATSSNLVNFILMDNTTNAAITLATGDIAVNNPGSGISTVTIQTSSSNNLTLIAPVTRTLNHKTKTKVATTGATDKEFTYSGGVNFNEWQNLGHCDVISLTTVIDADSVDVTENFEVVSGQTASHYGLGKIRVKESSNYVVHNTITVNYDYYTHSAGDFFTVDSYPQIDATWYEDITKFEDFELRSSVDFRPRKADNADNFSGTNASVTVFPEPNTQFQTDLQFYLPRKDKVFMNKNGFIDVVYGDPSLTPRLPNAPDDAMVLYELDVPAFTLTPSEVGLTFIDNKRYTMRDIGKIEKRVSNLEYYTTLSLLETEANATQVLDGSGVLRFKSGFLVDSFKSTKVGRTNSSEYKAGIDPNNGSLRPLFSEGNANMMYESDNSTTQLTGSLVTLPYTHTSLISQTQASGTVNVNPYSVFNWTGRIALTPSSDEWKDIDRRPDVMTNNDSVYNALLDALRAETATGTVWGSWTSNWVGSDSSDSSSTSGRTTTTTTTTTTSDHQKRTGINTSIETGTVISNLGDRQVSIAFRPYMRSRIVHFDATLMKPGITVYPYFDGVRVDDYVREFATADVDPVPLVGPNSVTTHPLGSTALTTDANGSVAGTFYLPNNSSLNFVSGTKEFVLVDSITPDDLSTVTTFASSNYYAKGQLEALENVILSTRTPSVQKTNVTDTKVITSTSTSTSTHTEPASNPPSSSVSTTAIDAISDHMDHEYGLFATTTAPAYYYDVTLPSNAFHQTYFSGNNVSSSSTGSGNKHCAGPFSYMDPLAQSFNVDIAGGAFVTSLDLYVSNKDAGVPLNVDIRTMVNGSPTQTVVPFSEATMYPNMINTDGTATQFVFESPVYLKDTQEYCFVVWANSDNYKVKIATQGEEDANGDTIISQPYAGVMFKSQNASTWTADQTSDITFVLHRAVFTTDSAKGMLLTNEANPSRSLQNNPFTTTAGSAGANTVTVAHLNHGMLATETVTVAGAVATNGITALELNTTHTIVAVKRNSYTVSITTAGAVTAGTGGGSLVGATQNIAYNVLHPVIQDLTFPSTGIAWGVNETSEGVALAIPSSSTDYSTIVPNTNYYPAVPKYIKSGSTPSIYLSGVMYSTVNNLSPVVDMARSSVIAISNIIDNNTDVAETDKLNGSSLAKYLTKTVQLDSESNVLKVYIDTNRPQATGIDVYYKAGSDAGVFDDGAWTAMTPSANTGAVVPFSDDLDVYKEVDYQVDLSASPFTMFSVKIVFTSTSTSKIPSARNLRAIALV